MRRCLAAILVVGLAMSVPRDAAAQPSENDIAAYAALISTPVGLLSPIMVSPGTKGEKAFNTVSARYSRFTSDGFDANGFGGSIYHQAGVNAAVSGTIGYGVAADCSTDCGLMVAGVDLHSTLWNNASAKSTTAMSINFQGSIGYGNASDGTSMSVAGAFPLGLAVSQTDKSRFSAFVAPGFGWGRMSPEGGTAESGTRPMVGAGAAWLAAAGWGLHASFQKIIIEDGGNSFGLGFSWRM
jgi:hypothetical protein